MSSPVFAKRGYTGPYVEMLQRRLRKELGDLSLADDGVFGSKTEEAVKIFQSSRYLEADGLVGEFTDACLFGKNLDKLRKVPKHVHQGNAMRCWAAATESWLTARAGRRPVPQKDIVDLLVADRGARASDGALIIPLGQGLWEGYFGLSPIAIAAADFTAESCVRRMAMFGPLMLGSRSHGVAGHVQVMWGARVRGGYPQIEVVDPLTTSSAPVTLSVVSIRSYSGGFTVWVPTRLPLLT